MNKFLLLQGMLSSLRTGAFEGLAVQLLHVLL